MDKIEVDMHVNSATDLLASQKRGLIPKDTANKSIKKIVGNLSEKSGLTPQEIAKKIKEQEKVFDEALPNENYPKNP